MKLLIVDDQAYVIQGLRQGIDWAAQGFSEIFTALNALEAREILSKHSIDVMLCDIEMPFENGLSLIRWIRSQGMHTRCILLTAHPDFAYAREAISLDVTDYVVQPAPYGEVLKAVHKALEELDTHAQQTALQRLGQNMDKNRAMLASTALSSWLISRQRASYYHILQLGGGQLPDFSQTVCLVMLCITSWETGTGWGNGTMLYALDNMLSELFAPYEQRVCIAELESDRYACLIWGVPPGPETDVYVRQFEFLRSVFKLHIRAEVAAYLENGVGVEQLPDLLKQLQGLDDENIARYSLVQTLTAARARPHGDAPPDGAARGDRVAGYQTMLEQGMAEELLERLNTQLDEQTAAGVLDLPALHTLYQDFMQALYSAAGQTGLDPRALFETPEGFAFNHNALHSLQEMRDFLQYACAQFKIKEDATGANRIAARAVAYIERNLDKPLRREDIAAQVHVSVGYLSRVFRQETGMSMKEYMTEQKLQLARSMLTSTSLPVSLVAMRVGYGNFSQFSKIYRARFGRTPSAESKLAEWEKKQEQEEHNET